MPPVARGWIGQETRQTRDPGSARGGGWEGLKGATGQAGDSYRNTPGASVGPATPQATDTMRLPAGLVSEPQTSSSSARPALPTRTRTPYLSLPHSQDAAGRGRAHGLRLALESHGRNTGPDGTCSESPVPPTTVPLHSRFPERAPPHQPGGQLGLRPGPLTRVPAAHLMHSDQTRETHQPKTGLTPCDPI